MNNETQTLNIDSKLTLGGMGLDKRALQEAVKTAKGKSVAIAQILAQVNDMKDAPSKIDATRVDTKFLGMFEGLNLLTGETRRSGVCYLPTTAADFLKTQSVEPGNATAFVITVVEDKNPNSATGYKFGVQAIVEKSAHDPFAALRKALPAAK